MDPMEDAENAPTHLSPTDLLAVDFHTSISSVIPSVVDEDDEKTRLMNDVPPFSVRKIYRNLLILSLAFVLLFTAYSGIASLQSSLNTKGNVGVNSLIITNAITIFSSIFLTGIVIDIFGLKWTMILAEIGYIFYIGANIFPHPYLMYIAASLTGLGSAPMWTSQATYIGRLARYLADHRKTSIDVITTFFFGIFFAIFATSIIWGNLVSYLVLEQSSDPQRFNCGIYFDPQATTVLQESDGLHDSTRYVLCGIYAGMGILSMFLLTILLDQIRLVHRQPVSQSFRKSFEVLRSLVRWQNIDQLLLVPLAMWTMMEAAFLTAQFTRAFITCLVGIRYIGLILMINGICNAAGSYLFGILAKYIGRFGCLIIGALLNYAMIILMFFWEPVDDQTIILFIIAGVWGLSAAIWQSQVIATFTVFFAHNDSTAIAKYRLWKAIGSLVNYSYASYINIYVTMIILFAFLTLSMICYIIAEIKMRWKSKIKVTEMIVN